MDETEIKLEEWILLQKELKEFEELISIGMLYVILFCKFFRFGKRKKGKSTNFK